MVLVAKLNLTAESAVNEILTMVGGMSERNGLLIASCLFFAVLAKDITVPACVLTGLAVLRWLGVQGLGMSIAKGQEQ